jgi:hypothetical protein
MACCGGNGRFPHRNADTSCYSRWHGCDRPVSGLTLGLSFSKGGRFFDCILGLTSEAFPLCGKRMEAMQFVPARFA